MTVTVPSFGVFENYWYGNGEIVGVVEHEGMVSVEVYYGEDLYRADYQAGRFASGLYFAKVEEV